jgi:hypothetical protein
MIDDCIDNLSGFKGIRICYPQPWNAGYVGVRAGWPAIARMWGKPVALQSIGLDT